MRATAQEFNDATKYGPYCEMFFLFDVLRDRLGGTCSRNPSSETRGLFFTSPNRMHSMPL